MNLITFDALSITVGVGDRASLRPGEEPWPLISLNYPPVVAHELVEKYLQPYARPEHCLVALKMLERCCEVTAWLVVPIEHGLVVAGNQADIDLTSLGQFLDQKAKRQAFMFSLGYHPPGPHVTRLVDASWDLVVPNLMTSADLDAKMIKVIGL